MTVSSTGRDPELELPIRLCPADAVALSRALLLAYDRERDLDRDCRRAGRTLRDAAEALRVGWEASVRGTMMQDHGASARRADHDEDAVWIALFHWLKGWATLPPALMPEAANAHQALEALFAEGVSFTELTYALEWAEADRRMAMLDTDGYAELIERLGGSALLEALHTAHAAYEETLGVARQRLAGPDDEPLAPFLDQVRSALGQYITALRTHSTQPHAQTLLAPLRRWHHEQTLRRRPSRVAPSPSAR